MVFLFDFLLLCFRQCFLKYFDTAEQVLEELFIDIGDLVVAERTLVVTAFENTCGDTDGSGVWRDIFNDNRVGTDLGVLADGDVPQ